MEMNNVKIIKELKQQIENDKQIIYECKKKIHTYELFEKDCLEEIESLKLEKKSISIELNNKTERFEETKNQIRNNFVEEIEHLQKKVNEGEAENEKLKNEVRKLSRISEPPIEKPIEDVDKFNDKIHELEECICTLNEKLSISLHRNNELEENQKILKEENANLNELIECKKEEAYQANELIQNLQDELMCLKSELLAVKDTPLDEQSRGNSLFAEVNDSRVKLLQKMKLMTVKFNDMVNERKNLLSEIENLRSEKARLIQLFQVDSKQYLPGSQEEVKALNFTIKAMEELIEDYKKEISELKEAADEPLPKNLKYFENHLKRKEKEIDTLRDKLNFYASKYILQEKNLGETGRDMVYWKWKAHEHENQIKILENKVKMLEDKLFQIGEKNQNNTDESEELKENKPVEFEDKKLLSKVSTRKKRFNVSNESNMMDKTEINENIKCPNEPSEKSTIYPDSIALVKEKDFEEKSKKTVCFSECTKKETDDSTTRRKCKEYTYINSPIIIIPK